MLFGKSRKSAAVERLERRLSPAASGDAQAPQASAIESRRHARAPGGREVTAILEGLEAAVANYGEGGAALDFAAGVSKPDRGVIELWRGGRRIRRGYAMRCWGEGQRVGYKILDDFIVQAAPKESARCGPASYERPRQAQPASARPRAEQAAGEGSGAASGADLRSRLFGRA